MRKYVLIGVVALSVGGCGEDLTPALPELAGRWYGSGLKPMLKAQTEPCTAGYLEFRKNKIVITGSPLNGGRVQLPILKAEKIDGELVLTLQSDMPNAPPYTLTLERRGDRVEMASLKIPDMIGMRLAGVNVPGKSSRDDLPPHLMHLQDLERKTKAIYAELYDLKRCSGK